MAERQHSEPKSGRSAKLGLGQALEEATRPKDQAAEVSLVEVTKGVVTAASTTPLVTWTIVEDVSTLLGGRKVLGSSIESELDAHELLRRGLPRAALSTRCRESSRHQCRRGVRGARRERSDPSVSQTRAARAGRALRRAAKRTGLEVG